MNNVIYNVWKNKKAFVDVSQEGKLRKDLTLS